uniref:Uncharacterized protein n=1 Tax=Parascaris univalens TaxID=6257 RepID=A0A915BLY4_PARUN
CKSRARSSHAGMLDLPEVVHSVPSLTPRNDQILFAEKRLEGIIRYLKQELDDNLEILENIRGNNQRLKNDIARYENRINEQNVQCQQYESHNADLREKKRSYLERLKAVSILVSQQNFDAGNWGIVLDEISFVSRELWDFLRRSITAERTAIKMEAAEEDKFAVDIEPMLRTRKELREQLHDAMIMYESQRSQIRLTEENLSRLGKIIDVYDAELWQLNDVKSDLQLQIYKLEQILRKNAQREKQPYYKISKINNGSGYDGGSYADSSQKQQKSSGNAQKSHKRGTPTSRWAVESRSVRQFGSKAPQGKTGVEASKELFDSSKDIAAMTRGLPVDVQATLHSGSDAVPSAFSEISESDLATPTARVKMNDGESEICSSNAKNRDTAQNSSSSKVGLMERDVDVQDFCECQSVSGRTAVTRSSDTYFSPTKTSKVEKCGSVEGPAESLNSSSELVWASGTTAPGSYSPLVEKILGGRIIQRSIEDAETRTSTINKTDGMNENLPECSSNEEDSSEKKRELPDYSTLIQPAISSDGRTAQSPEQSDLSSHRGILESGNSNKESTLNTSTSNYTSATTSEVDSYDSNYGIPPQMRRTSSQSSFFEEPSYLNDDSNDRSQELLHVPHWKMLTNDDVNAGNDYRPIAETSMDSDTQSSTTSDDLCEEFSLPTSAVRSSINGGHITEQKPSKTIASVELTKAQSPEESLLDYVPQQIKRTKVMHNFELGSGSGMESDSRNYGRVRDSSDHESFMTASPTHCTSDRSDSSSMSPVPDHSPHSMLEDIGSRGSDERSGRESFNITSNISYQSESSDSSMDDNISNDESKYERISGGQVRLSRNRSEEITNNSSRMTISTNSEVQRLNQAQNQMRIAAKSSELAVEL